MMVVPVLMTNYQVSEKPKIGPVTAHRSTAVSAMIKAVELPVALVTSEAKRSKILLGEVEGGLSFMVLVSGQ
ncbi:hypothetical protein GCM10027085_43250 [Spirosoma aerophilum]